MVLWQVYVEFIESRYSRCGILCWRSSYEDYLFIRLGEDLNDIEVCDYYVDNPLSKSMDRNISFS